MTWTPSELEARSWPRRPLRRKSMTTRLVAVLTFTRVESLLGDMSIKLNHTIVHSRDPRAAADFLASLFGLPAPVPFGPFIGVHVDNEVTLDFLDGEGAEIQSQHYAFLVDEEEFDQIFGRIQNRGIAYWADPGRTDADGSDQPPLRRPRRLLPGPERAPPRDHHSALGRLGVPERMNDLALSARQATRQWIPSPTTLCGWFVGYECALCSRGACDAERRPPS